MWGYTRMDKKTMKVTRDFLEHRSDNIDIVEFILNLDVASYPELLEVLINASEHHYYIWEHLKFVVAQKRRLKENIPSILLNWAAVLSLVYVQDLT